MKHNHLVELKCKIKKDSRDSSFGNLFFSIYLNLDICMKRSYLVSMHKNE